MTNTLQAVLDKKAREDAKKGNEVDKNKAEPKKVHKAKSRIDTALIGGHFPKPVLKQLRFLAVEEDKSNQELLSEALDLLFVKKGKKKINEIMTG